MSADALKDTFSMDVVGYHCLFMAFESIVFFALTLLVEFNESFWNSKGEAAAVTSVQVGWSYLKP